VVSVQGFSIGSSKRLRTDEHAKAITLPGDEPGSAFSTTRAKHATDSSSIQQVLDQSTGEDGIGRLCAKQSVSRNQAVTAAATWIKLRHLPCKQLTLPFNQLRADELAPQAPNAHSSTLLPTGLAANPGTFQTRPDVKDSVQLHSLFMEPSGVPLPLDVQPSSLAKLQNRGDTPNGHTFGQNSRLGGMQGSVPQSVHLGHVSTRSADPPVSSSTAIATPEVNARGYDQADGTAGLEWSSSGDLVAAGHPLPAPDHGASLGSQQVQQEVLQRAPSAGVTGFK
jgi:hypothetical protein